jgi:hypothetical protein
MPRKSIYTSKAQNTNKEAKPSKYLNKKTELYGIKFDSAVHAC